MLILLLLQIVASRRILIVGCGVGGAALAEFLQGQEVYIYDPQECGGRIDHIWHGSELVIETGGTMYIQENFYVQKFVQKYGLTAIPREGGSLGIYNESMLIETSSSETVTLAKMVYRYGLAPKYLKSLTQTALESFLKIYTFLEEGKYFKDYEEFLRIINLKDGLTIRQYLKDNHIDDLFIDEFVTAVMTGIYLQDNEINSIAGLVSLIAVFSDSYQIKGGNRQFIQENSKHAMKFPAKVETIERIDDRYRVNGNNDFDVVVIATLLPGITFIGEDLEQKTQLYNYHQGQDAHIYIIAGYLKNIYTDTDAPDTLLFIHSKPIKEIKLICSECSSNKNIYKILSQEEIDLSEYFNEHEIIKYQHWAPAYPKLTNLHFPPYKISENLYYLNSMEYLASCMEMEMISAKNIANRILASIKRVDDL